IPASEPYPSRTFPSCAFDASCKDPGLELGKSPELAGFIRQSVCLRVQDVGCFQTLGSNLRRRDLPQPVAIHHPQYQQSIASCWSKQGDDPEEHKAHAEWTAGHQRGQPRPDSRI
ncbi:hypothetical protein LTR46_011673, partial [Exophiala xenobiotica]